MAYNGVDMSAQHADRQRMEAECDAITLQEGDILYHPAGIWHSVESEEDSISINLSATGIRMGEFVTQALQGFLYQHLTCRKFIQFQSLPDLTSQISTTFKKAASYCLQMSQQADRMSSPGLLIGRVLHVDLDQQPVHKQMIHSEGIELLKKVSSKTTLTLNHRHLFQLLDLSKLPQYPDDLL